MATTNQGNGNVAFRTLAYDNPSFQTRQSSPILAANTAGSGNATGKFYAFAQLTVWGATFTPTAIGTSTYTVNGTATTSANAFYALFVTNTSTSSTIALATTTLGAAATGPFVLSGTGTAGTNVNIQGFGGLGGYWRYPLNTLGGTNTSMPWGTQTYLSGPPGGNNAGQGGLYMNPGDTLSFVNGTDATGTYQAQVEFTLQAPNAVVVA